MRFAYYGQPQPAPAEPSFGYYGEPVGYYAAPPGYGYAPGYGHAPVHGYAPGYAAPPGYGYAPAPGYGYAPGYGAPDYGPYGEHEPVGYYADEAAPVGYYGNDPYAPPMAGTAESYGAYAGYADVPPEMAGYGEPYGSYAADDPAAIGSQEFADEYPGVAEYGEYGDPEIGAYVQERPPRFNAGCPMPTNAGIGDPDTFAGYVRPATVGPTCSDLVPQTSVTAELPETLRPLW